MREAIADAEVMTTRSQGQPVASPLFAEVRAHRATLAKLIAQLTLADEDVPKLAAAQERACKAAQARRAGYNR